MADNDTLRAYLKLHLADGVGPVLFRRLVEKFGHPRQIIAASPAQLRKVKGVGDKAVAGITAVADEDVDAELELAKKHRTAIIRLDDEAYPAALKNIYDPPPVIYIRGRMEPSDALAFAIVGSRRCTHYGMEQAERFSHLLARAGFTVVSGGARGIDTAAHKGAMLGGGRTVAVMGCGLSRTYPPENAKLFDKIVGDGHGAIVSELPMQTDIRAGNFHARNRIISGLSLGSLIIEAARRSGALITARCAAEQGRVVFALPGRADSPLSQGTNALIRDGAILAQNLDDILEHLGNVGAKVTDDITAEHAAAPAGLNDEEQTIFDAIKGNPLPLDEIVRRTRLNSARVTSAMTMLVLKGAVVQKPGNVFAVKVFKK